MHRILSVAVGPSQFATFFHQDKISRTVAEEIKGVGPLFVKARLILINQLIRIEIFESRKGGP